MAYPPWLTGSEISQSQALAMWRDLNNKAIGQAMPVVFFNGKVLNARTVSRRPRDLLRQNVQVQDATLKTKFRWRTKLKAMAANGTKQRDWFLLYQSVTRSVIDYGLGLTTVAQSSLLKLDSAKRSPDCHAWNTRTHPLRPCDTRWTGHWRKMDRRWRRSSTCAALLSWSIQETCKNV